MHLHDLLTKGHPSLIASDGAEPFRLTLNGEVVLGVRLPKGRVGALRMPRASEYPHIAAGNADVGFLAAIAPESGGDGRTSVTMRFENADGQTSKSVRVGPEAPQPLFLPSMLDLADPFAPADLVIETDRLSHDLFIGSSRRVSRAPLYRLARGRGVEIGPGPKPQILNSAATEVIYVEEKPAEEWLSTYKTGASDAAWTGAGYRIGKAHDLPVDDRSLDFIFSSHVLEHLYNPLGHFDHWRRKLKPGGYCLCVVPGADGTKDFVLPPTSVEALVGEYQTGDFAIPGAAYLQWVKRHRPHLADPEATAEQLFRDRFSIHVHVYDNQTINALLRRLTERHGFDAFRVSYQRNAKDFIFALRASRA